MVPPRLERPLDKYHVGDKLRQLRPLRVMGLIEVGPIRNFSKVATLYFDSLLPLATAAFRTTPAAPS